MSDFFQDAPRLGNQLDDDAVLRSWLRRALPPDAHAEIEPGLRALGARAAGDLLALAERAEAEPPRHVPYDAWGRRTDDIVVSDAWKALDRVAAEEGIVATAYERAHGALSRAHQMARLYLFHPSSATYSCPLAMTDGAARTLQRLAAGDEFVQVIDRLTSRDPARMWTSGQWMTERTGGSDVSGTSTVARRDADGTWRLHGTKWFTSATTAQVALTLARVHDDTAVGEGHGVRKVAPLLNVTRLYNAVCAVASMRRAIALAADYATRRVAFGRLLAEHPLHVETLASMAVEHAGGFHLTFHLAGLLGREETGEATEDELHLLRLLTPVAKLYTGKQAVAVASEALEAFGGAGYIEDTGLPRLLRDAQVLSIWKRTTNVLALDVQRAAARLAAHAGSAAAGDAADREAAARRFAVALARTYAASLLLEHAAWSERSGEGRRATIAAARWCAQDLAPIVATDAAHRAASASLVRPAG